VLAKDQTMKFDPTQLQQDELGFVIYLFVSPFQIESPGEGSLELQLGGKKHRFKFRVREFQGKSLPPSFPQVPPAT
jgi:hypothetical protein